MALKLTKWDSASYLKTEEDMADYFHACIEEGGDDPAFIAHALGVIARARGMSQLAKEQAWHVKDFTKRSLAKEIQNFPPY